MLVETGMQGKSHVDEIAGECGVIAAVLKATNWNGDGDSFHTLGLHARLDYSDFIKDAFLVGPRNNRQLYSFWWDLLVAEALSILSTSRSLDLDSKTCEVWLYVLHLLQLRQSLD